MPHETRSADHRCPSRPGCFILPPDALASMIEEGDPAPVSYTHLTLPTN